MTATVTTFAGSTGGYTDATGTEAQFNLPTGVAVDTAGNVYVADRSNHRIRKVTPAGDVTTLAGSTQGSSNGTGGAAQFNQPTGVAVDAAGNVYVADMYNNRIRKVTPAGVVTTFAGSETGQVDANGVSAMFAHPNAVTVDTTGNVYVTDEDNNAIRKVTPAGDVTTLAGPAEGEQTTGDEDGTGVDARFYQPLGLVVDTVGNLYVTDSQNCRIRKVTPAGVVTTLAGSDYGYADGTGAGAMFGTLRGIEIDSDDNLFVADENNNLIRKVTTTGVVTTAAGVLEGGYADGPADEALFIGPRDVTVDIAGNLYVTEQHRIRKITGLTAEEEPEEEPEAAVEPAATLPFGFKWPKYQTPRGERR